MLISCPKCHSIYEIPDDLIGKTGKNFRCQACSNVWHALRSDALGYEEEKDELYIEALTVKEPPARPYPANKEDNTPSLAPKSGRKTHSSKEIIEKEGDPNYIPPKIKENPELTLNSDHGPAFTISLDPRYAEPEDKRIPYLTDDETLHITKKDQLTTVRKKKSHKKIYLLLLFMLVFILFFARREIVFIYPAAETYYNKIFLSGYNNAEYLRFQNIQTNELTKDNKKYLNINAIIYNDSFYTTFIPEISISGINDTFKAKQQSLKGKEKTNVEIEIPLPENNAPISFTLEFKKS